MLVLLARPRRADRTRHARTLEVLNLEGRTLLAAPDVTAPVTVAAVSGNLGDNGFYTGPVTVRLSATDPDDAASTLVTQYSLNGSPFVNGTSIPLTADGSDTIRFRSIDPAGNIENANTLVVNIDRTAPTLSVSANPTRLWPPNGKLVPVTVTGTVGDNFFGVGSTVTYRVRDEYGRVQPRGTATVAPNGTFSFTVDLQAARRGFDRNDRQYTILVTAVDQAGNSTTETVRVTVPHDQGRHNGNRFGNGQGDDIGGHDDDSNRGRRVIVGRTRRVKHSKQQNGNDDSGGAKHDRRLVNGGGSDGNGGGHSDDKSHRGGHGKGHD